MRFEKYPDSCHGRGFSHYWVTYLVFVFVFFCLFFIGVLSLKHPPHSLLNFCGLRVSSLHGTIFQHFSSKVEAGGNMLQNSEQPPFMSPILTFIYLIKRLLVQYPLNSSLCVTLLTEARCVAAQEIHLAEDLFSKPRLETRSNQKSWIYSLGPLLIQSQIQFAHHFELATRNIDTIIIFFNMYIFTSACHYL